MKSPPLPPDEQERLAALSEYAVLDTPPEAQYDDLTELAARICQAPIALISLIDEDRQWFKSHVGLEAQQTERDMAFCAHAILQPETFVVEDATRDERFSDNPLVTAYPQIRFYAGAPLITPEGHALGTLCVIDTVPRKLQPDHEIALRLLSRHVMAQLERRRRTLETASLKNQNAALCAGIAGPGQEGGPAALPTATTQQLRNAERARLALLSVLEDQKQIEARLRESEARYRHLFEHNPAPMLIYERGSLQLLAVNDAFFRHYGYMPEEADRLLLTDLYPANEREAISDLAARLQGYANVGEWHHIKKDGSEITIVASSHDTNFDGRKARIAVITDITDRKRAEQALQDNEERLRLALHAANQGLYDLDVCTGDAVVSPEYAQMLGYDPEEFHETNAAWRNRLHPEDEARVCRVYEDYIAGRIPEYRVEFRQLTKNGDWKWILSLGKVQERDAEGRPTRLLGTHTDITAMKAAEQKLSHSEARLKEAQRVAHVGSWQLMHGDGTLTWSDEVYRIFELDSETFVPSYEAFLAQVHPDDRDMVQRALERSVSKRTPYDVVYRLPFGDDRVKFVDERGETQYGESGAPIRSLGTVQDITVRKQAEDEIRTLNLELEDRVKQRTRQLENANRELETFTYSVSHDLKAPLRGIDGYSRLLIEDHLDQLDDEGRQFLHNVRHGVEQMNQLIEDLLAYSRMERRGMHETEVQLHRLVDSVLEERRDQLASSKAVTKVKLDFLVVHTDPEGMTMVLRNLIDNALKFSRDSRPPVIEITGRARDEAIILQISDNGIGFDMRFHDRIFDIFQRLQRAEDYPGTGVGLAIVHKAMQRMGGRVWAESAPGAGARFMIELPR